MSHIALFIEIAGMIVMFAIAVKYFLQFKSGRGKTLGSVTGPLAMAIGLAVLLARSYYHRNLPYVPITVWIPALVIGSLLSLVGFVLVIMDWQRSRGRQERG